MIPLPGRTQLTANVKLIGDMKKEKTVTNVAQAHLFAMTADEATIARLKQLCVLVSYTDLVRISGSHWVVRTCRATPVCRVHSGLPDSREAFWCR
jgi:hypothetical protein